MKQRHVSNHQKTISKGENKDHVMSIDCTLYEGIAADYGRKAVGILSRGSGDQTNALESVGKKCGLKARSLRRIINGETTPSFPVFLKIRAAYLSICESQIRKLEHEIEIEKKRFGDAAFADLDREISSLAEKVKQAKGR